jgi:predicted ABC-type sugar transport system permease subunit
MNPIANPAREAVTSAVENPRSLLKVALLRFETLLAVVLVVEIVLFNQTATNFSTQDNCFEILRLSVEIGLLALVMTPVILTGGIDLSVGSLLGLCAVLFPRSKVALGNALAVEAGLAARENYCSNAKPPKNCTSSGSGTVSSPCSIG